MAYSSIHLDRLRLRHLRLLELIEQHHSLRSVAEEFNLTQPAVSQMVKSLEVAFGTALVDRSVKGAELTVAGRHALNRARAGLAIFDHLASELSEEKPSLLKIGCNPAVTYNLLPEAMKELDIIGANLHVSIMTGMVGAMISQLLDGTQDCYIGRVDWDYIPKDMAPLLKMTPLIDTQLTIACAASHPLATQKNVSAQELLNWPWALTPAPTNNRMAIEVGFRNCGLTPPEPIIEMAADPNALVALAVRMPVLICIPRFAIDTLPNTSKMIELDTPDLKLLPIQTSLLTLAETYDLPSVQILREALLQTVSRLQS